MLVDRQIKEEIKNGNIKIEPYNPDNIDPGAYSFTLGRYLMLPEPGQTISLVKESNPKYKKIDISETPYILKPGEFVLAQTLERLTIAKNIGMLIEGRSTLARLGIGVHNTASLIHPGHADSIITLEIFNVGNFNIELIKGADIGKGIFFKTTVPAEFGYKNSGTYANQDEVMGAKITARKL